MTPLGGPEGAMAAVWDPKEIARIVAVGMGGSAISTDAGRTSEPIPVPSDTSAVAFSADGKTIYTAALDGEVAVVWAGDPAAAWPAEATTGRAAAPESGLRTQRR